LSTPSELRAYIDLLNIQKSIVDAFENEEVRNRKYREIAEQFESLQ